jgi:hypothetical protein
VLDLIGRRLTVRGLGRPFVWECCVLAAALLWLALLLALLPLAARAGRLTRRRTIVTREG